MFNVLFFSTLPFFSLLSVQQIFSRCVQLCTTVGCDSSHGDVKESFKEKKIIPPRHSPLLSTFSFIIISSVRWTSKEIFIVQKRPFQKNSHVIRRTKQWKERRKKRERKKTRLKGQKKTKAVVALTRNTPFFLYSVYNAQEYIAGRPRTWRGGPVFYRFLWLESLVFFSLLYQETVSFFYSCFFLKRVRLIWWAPWWREMNTLQVWTRAAKKLTTAFNCDDNRAEAKGRTFTHSPFSTFCSVMFRSSPMNTHTHTLILCVLM